MAAISLSAALLLADLLFNPSLFFEVKSIKANVVIWSSRSLTHDIKLGKLSPPIAQFHLLDSGGSDIDVHIWVHILTLLKVILLIEQHFRRERVYDFVVRCRLLSRRTQEWGRCKLRLLAVWSWRGYDGDNIAVWILFLVFSNFEADIGTLT